MGDTNGKRVVVIGAGLGGISAALSLAAEGYDVEIFEKNDHVGGKLNLLEKDGFSFDLGPSILTLPHYFEQLFAEHGYDLNDYVTRRELSPHWRCFFEDKTCIDLHPDPADTCAANPALDDEDEADMEDFLQYSRDLYAATLPGYFEEGLDTVWEMFRYHGLSSLWKFDLFRTMSDGVQKRIRNEYLQNIFSFFVKYVGSSPYDAPAVLNLLPHVQFEYGLWYVDGGLYELSKAVHKLARQVGIKLHLGTEIQRLASDQACITGVELRDGTRVESDLFVCNMEVIPAYRDLLHESDSFLKSLRKYEPACSGLVLHLGTDREYPQLAHHNCFFSDDPPRHYRQAFDRNELPDDPTVYVVAPTRTDQSQAPAGCENIKVLPHIPHLQDEPFTDEQYAALRERVLLKLERMGLEGLRNHITVEDMWTPEDIQETYYSHKGAIYGVVSDRKKNHGFKAPKESTRYDNLYFVGGSVNPGGGMPMAVLSGQQVRDRIANK
ncbi:MAG: phytoene desaturase family protein [Planctomycetota bacterium]